jgi:transposase
MPSPLVSDELWQIIEPLLPSAPLRPKGGRPPIPARAALTGILFVLRTGIPWEMLPMEMGCGSGVTCWRRLRDWQAAGVWDRLHRELLRRLRDADRIDWSRACMDSASIAAKRGDVPQVRTRRIVADLAPSVISSPIGGASRLRSS